MLGASWAQRRTYSLRLARSIQPWRAQSRHVALSLPRTSLQDGVEPFFSLGNVASRDRPRAPRYSTSISSVAGKAVALLKERKVEEAAAILSQFPEGEASQALVLEVVDKFLESANGVQDSEGLFAWLESFPDANSASSDVFHQIFDHLVDHGYGDSTLIRRFGLLCASKGYQDFVTFHITPVVLKQGSSSDALRWEQELSLAAAEFKGLQTSAGEVLEEDGWDYELAPPTMAQSSSILQKVEKTLPAVLPAAANDDLMFEDDGAEYIASAISLGPNTARERVAEAIDALVREGKWAEAHQFLKEIQEIGIQPPVGTTTTAIRTLPTLLLNANAVDRKTSSVLWDQYLDWLRALPPALPANEAPFLKDIADLLFHPDTRVLSLLRDTALALASRGYASVIGPRAIRMYHTHKHSPADIDFVQRLERINLKFWKSVGGVEQAEDTAKETNLELRSAAIRTLASIGQFERAVQLLPDASEGYLPAYDTLLRNIRSAGREAVAQYEAEVLSRMPTVPVEWPELPVQFPGTSDLAAARDWLEAAFTSDKPPPHPMVILRFIDALLASGSPDPAILTDLLNKAMKAGHLHALAFIYAEMVHYYRRGNHDAIIETAMDHLYFGYGLPRRTVERVQHILQTQRQQQHSEEVSSSYRYHDKSLLKIRSKIWPSTAICNIIWQINANKTYGRHQLEQQYNILLKTLEDRKALASSSSTSPPSSPPEEEECVEGNEERTKPWHIRPASSLRARYPNSDAFIPFMKKLMVGMAAAPKGVSMINDIVRLGLQPKVAHFSELAFAYAIHGGRRPALTILWKLEANFRVARSMKHSEDGKDDVNRKVDYGSPQNINTLPLLPDVHMYVHLTKAFVKTQRVQEAEEVLCRMEKYLGAAVEGNPHVQAVRRDLERLKEDLGGTGAADQEESAEESAAVGRKNS